MAGKSVGVSRWIRRFLDEEPPRAKSLCVTVLGDSIAPYGGVVWLRDLIHLLSPFGMSERLVRTSVFRLNVEGWLESRREGRRSAYALTASGKRRFEHASRRIYASPVTEWDGTWTIVILPRSPNGTGERNELREELEREGFGVIAPGVFVHPFADTASVQDILEVLELQNKAFVLSTRDLGGCTARPIRDLVEQCWDLGELAEGYDRFIARFQPVDRILRERDAIEPSQAFLVRTLLIHAYRRVILDDPALPAAILPKEWPGHGAYDLTRGLYRLIRSAADQYLAEALREEGTRLAPVGPAPLERFR